MERQNDSESESTEDENPFTMDINCDQITETPQKPTETYRQKLIRLKTQIK